MRDALKAARDALEPFIRATLTPNGAIVGLMREDFEKARAAIAQADAALSAPVDERVAFEAWWSGSGIWPQLVDRYGEGYKLEKTHAAWVAWQGAWKAALAVERERWMSAVVRADLQLGDGHIEAARQTLDAAMDRLDALKAGRSRLSAPADVVEDAARYRWLRGGIARTSGAPKAGRIEVFRWEDRSEGEQLKGAALDAAIDKARKEQA